MENGFISHLAFVVNVEFGIPAHHAPARRGSPGRSSWAWLRREHRDQNALAPDEGTSLMNVSSALLSAPTPSYIYCI